MICFYHSADLDGHCSGAIVKHKYPDCELYGIDYGDEFPWDKVKDQNVIMVDFSLQPFSDMIRLNQEAKTLDWIDHHISAIKDYEECGDIFPSFLDDKKAACELTWEYLLGRATLPYVVTLLGRYDVWDHIIDVLPFQYGVRLYKTDPAWDMENWLDWFNCFPHKILDKGKTILKYVEQDNEKYVKFSSFEVNLHNFKCIVINRMMTNSQMFDSVWDPEKYDVMLTFGYKKNQWTVSLYTDKEGVDVSEIAKKFGGGGHKQAAGFQCSSLPFFKD